MIRSTKVRPHAHRYGYCLLRSAICGRSTPSIQIRPKHAEQLLVSVFMRLVSGDLGAFSWLQAAHVWCQSQINRNTFTSWLCRGRFSSLTTELFTPCLYFSMDVVHNPVHCTINTVHHTKYWHGTIFKGPSLHVALQHLEVIILFVFRKRSSSVLTEYVSGEVSVSLLSQQTGGQAIPLS